MCTYMVTYYRYKFHVCIIIRMNEERIKKKKRAVEVERYGVGPVKL